MRYDPALCLRTDTVDYQWTFKQQPLIVKAVVVKHSEFLVGPWTTWRPGTRQHQYLCCEVRLARTPLVTKKRKGR